VIRIPAILADRIKAAAEDAWPQECCGLLAGRAEGGGRVSVTRIAESPNVAPADDGGDSGTHDRFEVDPKLRFDLMRELEGGVESIIGHYHSHPDHPAEPSERDIDMAFEPDLVWLIVAVGDGRAGEMTAWRLDREDRSIRPAAIEFT